LIKRHEVAQRHRDASRPVVHVEMASAVDDAQFLVAAGRLLEDHLAVPSGARFAPRDQVQRLRQKVFG
jgi:hypothetical protein